MVEQILERAGDIPPAFRDLLENYGRGGSLVFVILARIASMMFLMCVGAVFSTLGGTARHGDLQEADAAGHHRRHADDADRLARLHGGDTPPAPFTGLPGATRFYRRQCAPNRHL